MSHRKVNNKFGITVYYSVTHTFSRIWGLSGSSSVTSWIICPLGSLCSVRRTVRRGFWSGLGHLPCCCSICACCTKCWFWCWEQEDINYITFFKKKNFIKIITFIILSLRICHKNHWPHIIIVIKSTVSTLVFSLTVIRETRNIFVFIHHQASNVP